MLPVLECSLGRNLLHKYSSAIGPKQIGKVAYKQYIQNKLMDVGCRAYGTYIFSNNFSTEVSCLRHLRTGCIEGIYSEYVNPILRIRNKKQILWLKPFQKHS